MKILIILKIFYLTRLGIEYYKNIKVTDKISESKNKLLFSVAYRPKTNTIKNWFN